MIVIITGIGVADVDRSAALLRRRVGRFGPPASHACFPRTKGLMELAMEWIYPIFWIDRFHPHSVSQHVAFAAKSRAEVESFHAAALRAGGTDNGAPGLREGGYLPGYYCSLRWIRRQHRGGLP